MRYKTVFWDWNGTIIDDLQASIDSVNALLSSRGLTTFSSPDDYYKVFCFPVIEYYRKAGFDFNAESFEKLAVQYIDNYDARCKECKVFSDILDAIIQLKDRGVRQIILSASEQNGLTDWLKSLDILKYFDGVIGNDNIYAVGKADIAVKWLDEHNEVDINDCILVGDTTHDFEVSQAMGCKCALVARGHNSFADLSSTGAPVFADGTELLGYLNTAI